MSSNPSVKFYWKDWRSDEELRMCSLAAQGLWMRMLCYAAEADPIGYVLFQGRPTSTTDLARLTGASETEVETLLKELELNGVFSRDSRNRIYSRRMVRDEKRRRALVNNGNEGGNPTLARGTVHKSQRVRPYKRSDSPAKTKRILEKDGGRCHWCKIDLVTEWDGTGRMPGNVFHVDHVVAVRDGGGNDEANLVAACAKCNHERAKIQPTITPTITAGTRPTVSPTPKPTIPLNHITTLPHSAAERVCEAMGLTLTEDQARLNWPRQILVAIEEGLSLDEDIIPAAQAAHQRGISSLVWVLKRAHGVKADKQIKAQQSAPPVVLDVICRDHEWLKRCQMFFEGLPRSTYDDEEDDSIPKGRWSASWGPKPGEPGCLCPDEILTRFKHVEKA